MNDSKELRVGQTTDVVESLVNYYGISKGQHLMADGIFKGSYCISLYTEHHGDPKALHVMYKRELRWVGKLTITKVK